MHTVPWKYEYCSSVLSIDWLEILLENFNRQYITASFRNSKVFSRYFNTNLNFFSHFSVFSQYSPNSSHSVIKWYHMWSLFQSHHIASHQSYHWLRHTCCCSWKIPKNRFLVKKSIFSVKNHGFSETEVPNLPENECL